MSRRNPDIARIEEALAAEIAGLPDGGLLPSEARLMRRFGATRSAVRTAVASLERRFLVRRVQGRGTFANHRIHYPISSAVVPSFHAIVAAAGARARVVTLALHLETAEDAPGAGGELPGDRPVTRLERLGYIDDAPACYFEERVSGEVTADLATALRAFGSLGDIARGAGFEMRRVRLAGTVDVAPDHVCDRLELEPDTHTWFVESVNADAATGRVLMVSHAWTRIDRVRMVFER